MSDKKCCKKTSIGGQAVIEGIMMKGPKKTVLAVRHITTGEIIIEDVNDKKVGDIVVFQPIGKRYFGHIAMWNGKQWVSDFKQRSIIVHSDYRKDGCEYSIFRRGE